MKMQVGAGNPVDKATEAARGADGTGTRPWASWSQCSRPLNDSQMGLQSASVQVALFLMTTATFSLVVGAFAQAVSVGEGGCRGVGKGPGALLGGVLQPWGRP